MSKVVKLKIAELCIDIGDGQAIVRKDGEIEFEDCLPLSVRSMEFIAKEAKAFIKYRRRRGK